MSKLHVFGLEKASVSEAVMPCPVIVFIALVRVYTSNKKGCHHSASQCASQAIQSPVIASWFHINYMPEFHGFFRSLGS